MSTTMNNHSFSTADATIKHISDVYDLPYEFADYALWFYRQKRLTRSIVLWIQALLWSFFYLLTATPFPRFVLPKTIIAYAIRKEIQRKKEHGYSDSLTKRQMAQAEQVVIRAEKTIAFHRSAAPHALGRRYAISYERFFLASLEKKAALRQSKN